MLVNPTRHPHIKREAGQLFIDWLVSPTGQRAIADYRINGDQLFFSMPGSSQSRNVANSDASALGLPLSLQPDDKGVKRHGMPGRG
jgi:hypothetical protein